MEEHPSMLWVTIPPIFLLSVYLVRKWYLARKLRLYGIGKGALGFQTNVHRIRVTPEIAARLRRGEEVSPEEIAAASAQADDGDAKQASAEMCVTPSSLEETPAPQSLANEWLPESITTPKKRAKGKKR